MPISRGQIRTGRAEGELFPEDLLVNGLPCWFIDTNYNEESFFIRHAYPIGNSDLYKSLKTTLKAEINEESWDTLNSE